MMIDLAALRHQAEQRTGAHWAAWHRETLLALIDELAASTRLIAAARRFHAARAAFPPIEVGVDKATGEPSATLAEFIAAVKELHHAAEGLP